MITIPAALLVALIQVESGGVNDAISHGTRGREIGCLQITADVVRDVNRILKRHTTALNHRDALDRETAVFMCKTYLQFYGDPKQLGHEPTCKELASIWHCGPDFAAAPTEVGHYWDKVRLELLAQGAYDLMGPSPVPQQAPAPTLPAAARVALP